MNQRKVFKDDSGNTSYMRIVSFLVVGVVLFNWTYFNIENGEFVSLNWQDVGMILGSMGAKAYQKGIELNRGNKGEN